MCVLLAWLWVTVSWGVGSFIHTSNWTEGNEVNNRGNRKKRRRTTVVCNLLNGLSPTHWGLPAELKLTTHMWVSMAFFFSFFLFHMLMVNCFSKYQNPTHLFAPYIFKYQLTISCCTITLCSALLNMLGVQGIICYVLCKAPCMKCCICIKCPCLCKERKIWTRCPLQIHSQWLN